MIIHANQVGHLPGRPMRATLVGEEQTDFQVRSGRGLRVRDGRDRSGENGERGEVVYVGRSQPWPVCPEPTSGLPVQVLDFAGLPAGEGYRIEVAGQLSHPFTVGPGLYEPLAADALRFFATMRCGTVIEDEVYGRPAGHTGDTAVPALHHPTETFDVSGGWYDAGDYGKYVTSGALAVWQLLSTLELPAVRREAVAAECRWQLDWLLRMQVPAGDPLAGLAFHRVHGTEWPPLSCRPHEDSTGRVLHPPTTGAALHLAAAAAKGARLLHATDAAYAARLLAAARTAYEAAHRHPALLAPDDHARCGGGPYHDDDLTDDFYWAAAELWLTTGEEGYRQDVVDSPQHTADAFDPAGFDFHRVTAPARLDLARAGGLAGVRESVLQGANRLLDLQARQPWGQPYAPEAGWEWGSNGRILNNLVVLATAHELSGAARYHDAVAEGMDYLLGRNALGRSYITGYGTEYSRHQRNRQFGDLPPPPGTIAGGPNSIPAPDFPYDVRLLGRPPQCCYLDEPTSEVTNDICIRWNAPLVWVATYLTDFPRRRVP